MKHMIAAALICAFIITLLPAAEAADQYVGTDFFRLSRGEFNLEYEQKRKKDDSYTAMISSIKLVDKVGTVLGGGYRRYVDGKAFDGFHLGGGLNLFMINGELYGTNVAGSAFAVYGEGGYTKVFEGNIKLSGRANILIGSVSTLQLALTAGYLW